MKQPWKQWSWKQRSRFTLLVFLLGLSLVVWNAVDDSGSALIAQSTICVLLIPAVFVSVSGAKAAEQRFNDGDGSVYSPRAVEARKKRQAKQDAKRRKSS